VIKVMTLAGMKAEYSHTLFGFLWLLLKPALMVAAIVATFYFRAGDIELASYALTVAYGVVIWNVMSSIINQMSGLIYSQKQTFLKTTLPREVISLIPVARTGVDFIFGFVFILLAHIFLLQMPSVFSLFVLVSATILGALVSYGAGLIMAILSVYFRDLKYLVSYMMRILFFITPIFLLELPVGILTKTLYFNPFSLAITMGRAGEYAHSNLEGVIFALVLWAGSFLTVGVWFFGKKVYDVVDIV